ncbi:hypothetical protein C8A03DRAFT_38417 [Achaetomium macrosporum]|uniref:Mediator complex subunit 22 n=1 Tax=Achaetomium macrosporum TaxID=79813 RepID=A0AAN7HA99_9PEZI|nr:hypothetical protein C8A03DRAFT_38417 [Achaetomium macrosporum]
MDRDPNPMENLQERKNILTAEIVAAFRDLVNHGAAMVDNSASTGQAAYNSMALEILMSQIIKSTEDLLTLTRRLRELWIVGPLQAPGAHDAEAEQGMQRDAEQVFAMLNALRDRERQRMVQAMHERGAGVGFIYEKAGGEMPPGVATGGMVGLGMGMGMGNPPQPLFQQPQLQQFPPQAVMMVDQKGLVMQGQAGGQGPPSGGQHP